MFGTTDPSSLERVYEETTVGTKTSGFSGHGLTLEQPRGQTTEVARAVMSNMGKKWPCRRTKKKKQVSERRRIYSFETVRMFRAGRRTLLVVSYV